MEDQGNYFFHFNPVELLNIWNVDPMSKNTQIIPGLPVIKCNKNKFSDNQPGNKTFFAGNYLNYIKSVFKSGNI